VTGELLLLANYRLFHCDDHSPLAAAADFFDRLAAADKNIGLVG